MHTSLAKREMHLQPSVYNAKQDEKMSFEKGNNLSPNTHSYENAVDWNMFLKQCKPPVFAKKNWN